MNDDTDAAQQDSDKGANGPAPMIKKVAIVLCALLCATVVAEFVFAARDDGAFPHLNLYVQDDALGVRLLPESEQGFLLGTNPRSDIRVNAKGYRGADWGETTKDEILVVGDSQVFGLGVNDDETFSAQLEQRLQKSTKRKVLNAGVPTYGPGEYAAVVEEVLQTRPVTDVVYVVNMVNDLFENERPNRERHAVLDGWAVRSETMPDIVNFPGRTALFRQSHLLYAWRRLTAPDTENVRTASEGGVQDVLGLLPKAIAVHKASAQPSADAKAAREKGLAFERQKNDALERAERGYQELPDDLWPMLEKVENAVPDDAGGIIRASFSGAGDIVHQRFAESARPIHVTAHDIRIAAAVRRKLVKRWKKERGEKRKIALDLQATEQSRRENRKIWARPFDRVRVQTPLIAHLRRVARAAEKHGARLNVIVLPIDVQVHPREWEKYGAEPQDLSETKLFIDEILNSAHWLHARAASMMEPLRKSGAGTFLDGDIHLTARGHAAVAEALETLLNKELPEPSPGQWHLPPGRTVVPHSNEWLLEREIIVKGTSKANCGTWQIDEWFRITCKKNRRVGKLVDIAEVEAPRGETLAYNATDAATLVAALLPGESLRAKIRWGKQTQRMVVSADANGKITGALEAPVKEVSNRSAESYAADKQACENWKAILPASSRRGLKTTQRCADSVLNAVRPQCASKWPVNERECSEARTDGLRPRCGAGEVLALGTARCVRPCDPDGQCGAEQTTTCTAVGGDKLCL